jgi:hypothetical protein
MSSVQSMRMILTAGAAVAAVAALVTGRLLVATVMGFGVLAHLAMSRHLRRTGALPPTATPAAPQRGAELR